jgi:hypothetical protein
LPIVDVSCYGDGMETSEGQYRQELDAWERAEAVSSDRRLPCPFCHTSYLADLKHQYGDAPGLAMVSEVLHQLAQRQGPPARPGSARDPDPDLDR